MQETQESGSDASSSPVNESQLFIRAAGGAEGGKIFGLGSLSKRFYEFSMGSSSAQPSDTLDYGKKIANVEGQLEEMKQFMDSGLEQIIRKVLEQYMTQLRHYGGLGQTNGGGQIPEPHNWRDMLFAMGSTFGGPNVSSGFNFPSHGNFSFRGHNADNASSGFGSLACLGGHNANNVGSSFGTSASFGGSNANNVGSGFGSPAVFGGPNANNVGSGFGSPTRFGGPNANHAAASGFGSLARFGVDIGVGSGSSSGFPFVGSSGFQTSNVGGSQSSSENVGRTSSGSRSPSDSSNFSNLANGAHRVDGDD